MPRVWSERALKNLYFKGERAEGRAIQCKEGMKKKRRWVKGRIISGYLEREDEPRPVVFNKSGSGSERRRHGEVGTHKVRCRFPIFSCSAVIMKSNQENEEKKTISKIQNQENVKTKQKRAETPITSDSTQSAHSKPA